MRKRQHREVLPFRLLMGNEARDQKETISGSGLAAAVMEVT